MAEGFEGLDACRARSFGKLILMAAGRRHTSEVRTPATPGKLAAEPEHRLRWAGPLVVGIAMENGHGHSLGTLLRDLPRPIIAVPEGQSK
jgi:hypothetical protein